MNRLQRAMAAVYCDALAEQVTRKGAEFRVDLRDEAVAEFRRDGGAVTWRYQELGSVSLAVSRESVQVTDHLAFAKWVAARYPSEMVMTVRPSFQAAFLERARQQTNTEVLADPDTGEVIPGVQLKPGGEPKHLTIRPDPGAKAMLGLAAAQGLERIALDSGAVVLAELEQA